MGFINKASKFRRYFLLNYLSKLKLKSITFHFYQINFGELSRSYPVRRANIVYLLAMIAPHALAILDQTYINDFKEQDLGERAS